eukprot:TRINITY_DN11585_c0_g1_i3.p3 TRINITY_DN11585_c0_g1~~TRINITY_DN11585_c0_g1_i3.p3  ORF type:complete len:163 (-),score=63.21 TRINITY_DN11585_c0_g1_i3:47-535(-)
MEENPDEARKILEELPITNEEMEETVQDITNALRNIQDKRLEYTRKILDLHINKPFYFWLTCRKQRESILEMIDENDYMFRAGLGKEGLLFFEKYPEMKKKLEDTINREKEKKEENDRRRGRVKSLHDPFAPHRIIVPSVAKSKRGKRSLQTRITPKPVPLL